MTDVFGVDELRGRSRDEKRERRGRRPDVFHELLALRRQRLDVGDDREVRPSLTGRRSESSERGRSGACREGSSGPNSTW